jgi:iron complex transport system substrate-binding protein
LTEETTETLYLLGEDWRIVGISGFTTRPACARREKRVVSAFTKARIPDIVKLKPDLVLGFSDIQAKIAAQLVEVGIEVHIFNHRTVAGILRMIRVLGGMLGCTETSQQLSAELESRLDALRHSSATLSARPRVYFEEWNDPIITGIAWVSELIEIAGGIDCFADLACQPLAKHRIIADAYEPVKRDPEIIIGSWCGNPFNAGEVTSRPGWEAIAAVRNNRVYEIDSSIILQPGPAALTDGVDRLSQIIRSDA